MLKLFEFCIQDLALTFKEFRNFVDVVNWLTFFVCVYVFSLAFVNL